MAADCGGNGYWRLVAENDADMVAIPAPPPAKPAIKCDGYQTQARTSTLTHISSDVLKTPKHLSLCA